MSSRQPTDDEPIWLTQKSVVIDDPGGASRVVEPTPADLGQLPEDRSKRIASLLSST